MNKRCRVNTAALAVVLVTGCGGASGSTPGVGFSPRQVGACSLEDYPEELPGPELLVDTASLGSGLRELVESDSISRYVVLTMRYGADGLNMRREIIEHTLNTEAADSVQELVFAHRRGLPPAEREWGARLRIDLDDDITYHVNRSEYCSPRPRNPDLEADMRAFLGTGPSFAGGVRSTVVLLRITVHPGGYVTDVRLLRGGVPGSPLEQNLATYIRQFSFYPATIDGTPTLGELDVPVRIATRR